MEAGGAGVPLFHYLCLVMPNSANPQAITLSQLNTLIGNAIRLRPEIQRVWVVAELSDFRSSGGHFYGELIEKNQLGQTVAKLRANMWAGTANALRRKFFEATGQDIQTGLKVLIQGSVTHHNQFGLSFNIQDIDPSYTLGDLERQRREILEQLHREGILEANRSLPFPVAPQRIAVISAAGAAGYGDFTNQLDSSPEGFKFYPLLFGAVMQGERTAPSVIAALDRIELAADFWDAVVIIRGGGSTSDLNGFDNLELARRVALCPIPVIVGIGHERDRTVLDDIARVRCKTPTAVAAGLIDCLRRALTLSTEAASAICRHASDRLAGESRRLATAQATLPALAQHRLSTARSDMHRLGAMLPAAVGTATARGHARLSAIATSLDLNSRTALASARRELTEKASLIARTAPLPLERQQNRLDHLQQMAEALSPANTLKRGYSITRINGRAITSAANASKGDTMETTLADGTLSSRIL